MTTPTALTDRHPLARSVARLQAVASALDAAGLEVVALGLVNVGGSHEQVQVQCGTTFGTVKVAQVLFDTPKPPAGRNNAPTLLMYEGDAPAYGNVLVFGPAHR